MHWERGNLQNEKETNFWQILKFLNSDAPKTWSKDT